MTRMGTCITGCASYLRHPSSSAYWAPTKPKVSPITARFQFQDEEWGYWREFHVLRESVCDVVLGKQFLAGKKTPAKFA